jgi:ATP-dependent Clp protease adapter protein ClpS
MNRNYFIDLKGTLSKDGLRLISIKNWMVPVRTLKYIPCISNGFLELDPKVPDGERVSFLCDYELKLYFGNGLFHMTLPALDIIMAGEMKFRNGKVFYICNLSDAFEPQYEQFVEFVKRIKKLPFVSNDVEIEFYDYMTNKSRRINIESIVKEKWKPNIETEKKSLGPSDNWFIFLHNDCVNSKKDVIIVLFNNTKLPYEDCERIMNCAHLNSSALICQGPYPEIENLQEILENAGLKISISLITDVSSSN